jgi:hypothetical protein
MMEKMELEEMAKPPWKTKGTRVDCLNDVSSAFLDVLTNHQHGYILRVGRMTKDLFHTFRQILGDNNPRRQYRWQWRPRKHILQKTLFILGGILAKGTMRLWRQRSHTALQIFSKISHLPSVLLETLPTLPHAADRLSRETFRVNQTLRDTEEGLTPELLGMLPIVPTPPEDSTEPSDLPTMEIQHMVRNLTGIRQRRGRQSLRRTVRNQPSSSNKVTSNISFANTPIERILLRVIKQKRAKDILTINNTLATLPVSPDTTTDQPSALTTISTIATQARVAGGMRITSLPNRSKKRRRENESIIPMKWTRTSSDMVTLEVSQPENDQQSTLTIENPSPTVGIQVINQLPTIGSIRRSSTSKRKRPPDDNNHKSLKRLRAVVHQDAPSITPMELSSTDNINLNVCVTSDMSASSGTHSKPLTTSDVLMETGINDIFTFTDNVVSFTPPADRISGMDFVNDVLPIHVVNVCVLASPVSLELASAVD